MQSINKDDDDDDGNESDETHETVLQPANFDF